MDTNNTKIYSKNYYQNNKDKWNEYIDCEICGGKYCRNTRTNHFKSKKHELGIKEQKIKELENKINMIRENIK